LIIDFHTHCFPDSVAKKAIPRLAGSAGIEPRLDGTVSSLLNSMDNSGIDVSVMLPIATRPEQTQSINNWAGEYATGRLLSFGTIHPGFKDWEHELLRIHEMGLKGLKFHPEYQGFDIDDPSMIHVYKAASEMGLILLFHAGIDFAFEPPCHCPPEKLVRVAERIPDARIVAAHLGGYLLWEDVLKYLAGSRVYLDTSFTLGIINTDLFFQIVERHGTDRLVFGTDSPWSDQESELATIRSLGLDNHTEYRILGGNAQSLLETGRYSK
jgi:predicted TIM-barrel fold metal-dependent hydrolase